MSDDQFCFGLFGIEDDAEKSVDKKEQVDLSKEIELNSKSCCICNTGNVKYCCPGCGFRTCSLDCVKEHKSIYECDGKRDRVPFVKMDKFDQSAFISDYFLLEETETTIDGASRRLRNIAQSRSELPSWLNKIRLEAKLRGTQMKIMPAGFEKRKRNRTMFYFKEKCLQWTVEFKFQVEGNDNITIFKDRVSERLALKDVIAEVINPSNAIKNLNHFNRMKPFRDIGVDDLLLLLKVDGRKMFWKISAEDTLAKSLEGKTIVEYPTFIVTSKCYESHFPLMITTPLVNVDGGPSEELNTAHKSSQQT